MSLRLLLEMTSSSHEDRSEGERNHVDCSTVNTHTTISSPCVGSADKLSIRVPESTETLGDLVDPLGPMCVGPERMILPVANASQRNKTICKLAGLCDQVQLSYDPLKIPNYFQNDKDIVFWQADSGEYILDTNNVSQEQQWPPLTDLRFERGNAILLDSCVGAMQFGHAMTVLLKLIIMGETGFFGQHLVHFFPEGYARWSSNAVDTLLHFLAQTEKSVSNSRSLVDKPYYLNSSQLATKPTETLCFRHALTPRCSERYYRSAADAELVQSFLRRQFPWFAPTTESCPPPVAAVLYRSGLGAGLRKILDYHAVHEALRANGISNYVNITVSQETSLEESVRLFSSFGLLITTHSSQLKLLAFSHPDTVVVELRPKESAKWFGHSVFSEGPDRLGIHYYSHSVHRAADCPMSKEACENKGNIYSDIWPNRTALEYVIGDGLHKQRRRCKINWT